MLSSPYWAFRRAKRTAYILTDRRAVVLSVGWRSKVSVRAFEAEGLTDLQRTERADGSGDLVFATDVTAGSRGRTRSTEVGFIAVRDVKEVEGRVRRLVQQAHHAQDR
jgi:hypothetical protein